MLAAAAGGVGVVSCSQQFVCLWLCAVLGMCGCVAGKRWDFVCVANSHKCRCVIKLVAWLLGLISYVCGWQVALYGTAACGRATPTDNIRLWISHHALAAHMTPPWLCSSCCKAYGVGCCMLCSGGLVPHTPHNCTSLSPCLCLCCCLLQEALLLIVPLMLATTFVHWIPHCSAAPTLPIITPSAAAPAVLVCPSPQVPMLLTVRVLVSL